MLFKPREYAVHERQNQNQNQNQNFYWFKIQTIGLIPKLDIINKTIQVIYKLQNKYKFKSDNMPPHKIRVLYSILRELTLILDIEEECRSQKKKYIYIY